MGNRSVRPRWLNASFASEQSHPAKEVKPRVDETQIAKVTAVVASVLGRKIHISFGAFVFKVDETQTIRVVP
jgi:hypothetical protein